jgi:hypothetical protein
MKGMVFTEFTEMVEKEFGLDVLDKIITSANLPSKGIYNSASVYDHKEIFVLVEKLSEIVNIPEDTLFKEFGRYMFAVFSVKFKHFFQHIPTAFTMLERIDSFVHVEVNKLYPDANTPKFICEKPSEDLLILHYSSPRKMGAFAEGLIIGCLEHYKENAEVKKEDASSGDIVFSIRKQ